MAKQFVVSRKISKSIEDGIDMLCYGPFTERDVKLLLIDLREVAKHILAKNRNIPNAIARDFASQVAEFIEISDFIAHASRDRGLIEDKVRTHVQNLRPILDVPKEDFPWPAGGSPLHASKFFDALLLISEIALSRHDIVKTRERYDVLCKHQSDIQLCVLSLVQDTQITLKDDEGYCLLQLWPFEGKYRVYCRVMTSKTENELGGKEKVILGFPVLLSVAECIDPIILACDHNAFPPPVFETFRDDNLRLQVRMVDAGGDVQPEVPDYRYKWQFTTS